MVKQQIWKLYQLIGEKTFGQEQATGWKEPLKEDSLPVETVPLCRCPSGINSPQFCLLLNQLLV